MRGTVYQRASDKKCVGCVDLTQTQYANPSPRMKHQKELFMCLYML